jgi:hypothetical protein
VRLKRIKSDHLIRTSSEPIIPLSLGLWLESIIFAASTRTFFGSHPRKAHVPPNGSESIIATLHPGELHSDAVIDAAVPVPITIKSNVCSCLSIFVYQQNSPSYMG